MPIYYKVIHGETIDKRKLKPFWVKNTSNSNMSIMLKGYNSISTSNTRKIYYSFNLTDWTEVDLIMNGNIQHIITLNSQNTVYIKSDPFDSNIVNNLLRIGLFNYTTYECGGNINSFVFGNEFTGEETSLNVRVGVTFQNMIDASNIVFPATTLTDECYAMMFNGCNTLTNAPVLPATTLAKYCYYYMFTGCTALTKAPDLPATTLADRCYQAMFSGCISLNSVKCLATSDINFNNFYNWLNNVSSIGTFYKTAGVTWPAGANGIPTGWTVEEI